MVTYGMVNATKIALVHMEQKYCKLSQLDYDALVDYNKEPFDDGLKEAARKDKYLERPFAYEFYHQLRKLMDCGSVNFGDRVIQAEVDKEYQHYFENSYIPDFIIHIPDRNDNKNFAVLEFKLSSNLSRIECDFDKLIQFRNPPTNYAYTIEVILGNRKTLDSAFDRINKCFINAKYKGITIIEFDTDLWKAKVWKNLGKIDKKDIKSYN